MKRYSPSPKAGLSLALGLALACASGPLRASFEPLDEETPALQSFELIPDERSGELPAELRAQQSPPSFAEALGLASASGSHTVHLHWVVRENRGLSGYRVTLVAADGLPGHLAARWWIPPTQGEPLGDGLTAYSARISLALDGQAPVTAAIEAVDVVGHAVVLGVRRAVAEADPGPRQAISAQPESISANPIVLLVNRLAPSARAAAASPVPDPQLPGALVAGPMATFLSSLDPKGAVTPRGPPTACVTA
jgi:hypothetical protein